ncbi:hypothetical protein Tco_1393054 [Tanacetum coccineum]
MYDSGIPPCSIGLRSLQLRYQAQAFDQMVKHSYRFRNTCVRSGSRGYAPIRFTDQNLTSSSHGNKNSGADATKQAEVSARRPGYPLRVILTWFATHVDNVDTQGECRRLLVTLDSNVASAGHINRYCQEDNCASSSGHADKKPDASGRDFATYTGSGRQSLTGSITAHRATALTVIPVCGLYSAIFMLLIYLSWFLTGKTNEDHSALKSTYLTIALLARRTYNRNNFQEYLLFAMLSLTLSYSRAEPSPKLLIAWT